MAQRQAGKIPKVMVPPVATGMATPAVVIGSVDSGLGVAAPMARLVGGRDPAMSYECLDRPWA
jgi:hypothetical protein